MKKIIIIVSFLMTSFLYADKIETYILHHKISKYKKIVYKREIRFDSEKNLFYVEDYFRSGQIQMKGTYSSFDKTVKENYWCNYKTNTKQGLYRTWYKNGNLQCRYNFTDGKKNGLCEEYYSNGQISEKGYWIPGNIKGNTRGMMHGNFKAWSKDGKLICNFYYRRGLKVNQVNADYHYIVYTPRDYKSDLSKKFPLIIYLHGGSQRGSDLNKLYNSGIPDQIHRGREFPFIIVAPQCPELIRWSTDKWFEIFFEKINSKYRIDTERVYLTGESLGGAGTWYLAIKHPDKFTAIAPMCGFSSHMDFIDKNTDNLSDIPIWAFHGVLDKTVPVEETDRMIEKLRGKNKNMKYSRMKDIGHWISWLVYPKQELYDWFLKHKKNKVD